MSLWDPKFSNLTSPMDTLLALLSLTEAKNSAVWHILGGSRSGFTARDLVGSSPNLLYSHNYATSAPQI